MQRNRLAGTYRTHTDTDDKSPQGVVKAKFPGFFNHMDRHIVRDAEEENGATNKSYHVYTDSSEYMARIPGKGTRKYINRENESHDTAIAYAAGITPEVVYDYRNGMKVTRYLLHAIKMNSSLLRRPENVMQVVAVLKKLHAVETFATTIDVFARNQEWIKLIAKKKHQLPAEYLQAAVEIEKIKEIISTFNITKVPCHNDTTPGNFIMSAGRLYVIDLEYCGNNDPVWDLCYLAMEAEFTQAQCEFLLRAYFGAALTEEITRRFYLYQPVVEYSVALWSRLQMANQNIIDGSSEVVKQEAERIKNCMKLLKTQFIQNELNPVVAAVAPQAVEDDDVAEKPRWFSCCGR